jgi:hypothetical protein
MPSEDMPAGTSTQDGNGQSFYPFIANSFRYQVYAASEFDVLTNSAGGWLRGIFFRVDATNGSSFGYTYTLQINLSVTPRGPDELSPVFSENVGTTETIVFPLADIVVGGGQGIPLSPFDILLPFRRPFLYDPSTGNLLFDLRIAQKSPGSTVPLLDAWDRTGDSVSRVYWGDMNASTGLVDTVGLATRFEPWPNPLMNITTTTNSVVLTWRTTPDVFTLQTTDVLSPQATWQPITNGIVTQPLQKTYEVPLSSATQRGLFPAGSLSQFGAAVGNGRLPH